jgi:fumarylacetoacetase
MAVTPDATHDPGRRSWIDSANREDTDFPLQNLPLGVFRRKSESRIGVAIGDRIFDLHAAAGAEIVPPRLREPCLAPRLNRLLAAEHAAWPELRGWLSDVLSMDSCPASLRSIAEACVLPAAGVEMLLPMQVGDYTDFYASRHHATNVGALFRPDQPLLPNYAWVPIGYHGRCSSLVISGTGVRRPNGQLRPETGGSPVFGPTRQLDYELELGAVVGGTNALGEPVPIAKAGERVFGLVLLNDWSARDIQAWEYQPLGPFLGKSFATTLSPWVVTLEALAPFRTTATPRGDGNPPPLPYLTDAADVAGGAFDLQLDVFLATERMRRDGIDPVRLTRSNLRHLYWTLAQLVTHHTSNGCNLQPGDLLGTGTVSGPEPESVGCLLERTRRGTAPLPLPSGETRTFLEDGDEIVLRAFAERSGYRRIGFGECRGRVLAAHPL